MEGRLQAKCINWNNEECNKETPLELMGVTFEKIKYTCEKRH